MDNKAFTRGSMVRYFMLRTSQRVGRGWMVVGRRGGFVTTLLNAPLSISLPLARLGGFLGCLSPPSRPAR